MRISPDGMAAELLWGYRDGGSFTSELPAHLMSHMARLRVEPQNRVVMHSHPTHTLAMNYVHELDERKLTHTLWEDVHGMHRRLPGWGRRAPLGCSAAPTKSAGLRRKK